MSPTRSTWDRATDEQILEEVDALVATGRMVVLGASVVLLLKDRGLYDQVCERLYGKPGG